MSILGAPINWLTYRRKMSNASWIEDMRGLGKSLQLCSTCQYKMPHRWQATFHYSAFTLYHGVALCDSCRHEDTVTLYLSTDDPWFAQCETQARISAAIQAEERAFAVTDRRRVVA